MNTFKALLLSLLGAATAVTGCASSEQVTIAGGDAATEQPLSLGDAVAELAMGMVGAPYRMGGADPRGGFDSSGLVFYAYSQAGLDVPRTARELFREARKIALGEAGAGDLMFFQDQQRLSHVGIYIGDNLFVHAPAGSRHVVVGTIDAPYYQQQLVAVGRLLPN